jgi:hypothetical protein
MDTTTTPPRDHDPAAEDFAPVIPLRRRQFGTDASPALDREPGGGGLWDPDAPPASLTERRPPRQPQGLALPASLAGNPATRTGHAQASPQATGARRFATRRRGLELIAPACSILAVAAIALAVSGGGHHSPNPDLAKAPPTIASRHAAMNATPPAQPERRTQLAAASTRRRARAHGNRSHRTAARTPGVVASTHVALTATTPDEPTTPTEAAPTATQPPPTAHRAVGDLEAARRRAATAACVPGELGC